MFTIVSGLIDGHFFLIQGYLHLPENIVIYTITAETGCFALTEVLPFSSHVTSLQNNLYKGRNGSLDLCGEDELAPALSFSLDQDHKAIDISTALRSCFFIFVPFPFSGRAEWHLRGRHSGLSSAGRKHLPAPIFYRVGWKPVPLRGENTSSGPQSIWWSRSLISAGRKRPYAPPLFLGRHSGLSSAGRKHLPALLSIWDRDQKSVPLRGENTSSLSHKFIMGQGMLYPADANRPDTERNTSPVPMALYGQTQWSILCGEKTLCLPYFYTGGAEVMPLRGETDPMLHPQIYQN